MMDAQREEGKCGERGLMDRGYRGWWIGQRHGSFERYRGRMPDDT